LSTNNGEPRSPSNIWKPAMLTRFIHSRSAMMPWEDTLPNFQ
jgi:hypothetical protein